MEPDLCDRCGVAVARYGIVDLTTWDRTGAFCATCWDETLADDRYEPVVDVETLYVEEGGEG